MKISVIVPLYNEQEGYLETFRPYALPAGDEVALKHSKAP